jgi:hypothetical protein
MAAGAEGIFNAPGHRLANGDRVQVTVVPVPPGQRSPLKADSELDLVQRIGDRLGLRDPLPQSPGNRDQENENAPLPDSVRTVGALPADISDIDDVGAPSRIATESRPTATPGTTADTASQSSQGADPPAPVRVTATSQASYEVSAGGSSAVPSPETDEADADAEAEAVATSDVDKGKGRAVPADPADDQASPEHPEGPAQSPDAYRRQLAGYDAEQTLADYGSALAALGRAQADFDAAEAARASGEGTSHGREWAEAQGRMHDAQSRVTDVMSIGVFGAPSGPPSAVPAAAASATSWLLAWSIVPKTVYDGGSWVSV